MSEAANVLGGFYSELENLLSEDDLGAVIIHMNDTYQIEERRVGDRLELPGFARIAEFIRKTRGLVLQQNRRG